MSVACVHIVLQQQQQLLELRRRSPDLRGHWVSVVVKKVGSMVMVCPEGGMDSPHHVLVHREKIYRQGGPPGKLEENDPAGEFCW